MDRPFAPSPRRRALARAAGLVLASPAWTAAIAVAAGVAAIAATVSAAGRALSVHTRDSLAHAADGDVVARATASGGAAAVVAEILAAAAPMLVACAAGTIAAAAVLARGLFVPRREVRGAPSLPDAPAADAALGLARAAVLAAVAVSFVATQLPGIAELVAAAGGGEDAFGGGGGGPEAATLGGAIRGLALAALAHLAAAAVVLAALDAVVRHLRLAGALRMTAREARDDARESGNDGNARRRLRDARAHDPRDRLRDAAALLVGTDAVVALRWSPGMTSPAILVAARGLHGRQLVAAARTRGIPALADDMLAEALASTRGPAPPAHHAALARVLASIA